MRVTSVSLWQRSGPFISDIISTQSVWFVSKSSSPSFITPTPHAHLANLQSWRCQAPSCRPWTKIVLQLARLVHHDKLFIATIGARSSHAYATILKLHVLAERKMYALASAPTSQPQSYVLLHDSVYYYHQLLDVGP
ncbi:hypothetical protein FRC02_000898 [Tulasnella sp. 418]|nr:hypothetical protein FRC02_000898 [Tulasnella sp. 418]